MAEAIIDWKRIKSRFVEDDAYEHINAPQWVDLTAADDDDGDDAWFCRASCDHPKTLEEWPLIKSNETALQVSNHNKTMTKPPFLGLSNKTYYVVVNQDSERIAKVGEEGIKSNTEMQGMMRGCLCADYLLFTVAECCHELRKVLQKNNFT